MPIEFINYFKLIQHRNHANLALLKVQRFSETRFDIKT